MRHLLKHPIIRHPFTVLGACLIIVGTIVIPLVASATTPAFTEYPTSDPKAAPSRIVTGPDGNLWFGEDATNKVAKFNPATGVTTEYSLPVGPPMTYSQGPGPIVAGPDGNIWFADEATQHIAKLTTSGMLTEYTVSTSFLLNDSLIVGPDGNLWFTSFSSNRVGAMNTGGVIVHSYAVSGNPEGISAGPDGNLWFAEQTANQVARLNPATGAVTTYGVGAAPLSTARGPDGNVWFTTMGNTVGKVNPSSGTVTQYPLTTTTYPVNITAGPDGNMWFTISYVGLGNINPSTGVITGYNTPSAALGGAWGLTTGPDKNIWYTVDNFHSQIGRACLGLSGSACPSITASYVAGVPGGGATGSDPSGSGSGSSGSSGSSNNGNTCPNATSQEHSASGCSTDAPGHNKSSAGITATTSPVNAKITLVTNKDDGTSVATVAAGVDLPTQTYDAPDKQTLFVDGSLGAVTIQNGATIKGNGKVGKLHVEIGAILAPGHSPGCLASGDLLIEGSYQAQLGGTQPCSGYDQVNVTGTVTLTGANLEVSLANGFAPKTGQIFTIINNTGTTAVKGMFANLAEGGLLIQQNTPYTISYKGGDGNDVVLTVAQKDASLAAATAAKPTAGTVKGQPLTFTSVIKRPVVIVTSFGCVLVIIGAILGYRMYRKSQQPPTVSPPAPPTAAGPAQ